MTNISEEPCSLHVPSSPRLIKNFSAQLSFFERQTQWRSCIEVSDKFFKKIYLKFFIFMSTIEKDCDLIKWLKQLLKDIKHLHSLTIEVQQSTLEHHFRLEIDIKSLQNYPNAKILHWNFQEISTHIRNWHDKGTRAGSLSVVEI